MKGDASGVPETLMPQFLAWLAAEPRTYGQAMAAWRSNCPRMTVWEDARAEGLVRIAPGGGAMAEAAVRLTAAGQARLGDQRRAPAR